jgi:acyl transferase domain-containing protein/phosphopantetheinyl transferase
MTGQGLTPVAMVGMAVLLPGSPDLAAYWTNLVAGADAITDVPEGRWDTEFHRAAAGSDADRVYCRRGGFVDGLAEVDLTRFGITPDSAAGSEPDQLIALQVAAAALADAGGEARLPERHRIGVVLGRGGYLTPGLVRLDQRVRTAGQLVRTLGELLPDLDAAQLDRVRAAFTERLGPDRPESAAGLLPHLTASRVADRLDLRGPAYTVDAACASSLVAVDQAVAELAAGRCDLMLAGGVHHCHDITLWSVLCQLRTLSPSQHIRPFHRAADGTLVGEGTGVVVLKRLADARRDGDRIYAVIRGTGVASDGQAGPGSGGGARAVRQAWHAAGLDPSRTGAIGLLEAHGAATPDGDAAELATVAEVFGAATGTDPADRPVIGSVKSMIGHTLPAAGVAGLVKAALAVHHGMLLPTLHCDDPNPALASTRFRTIGSAQPWAVSDRQPVRRAAVNAFGFGGINAHVVLEQAPTDAGATAPPPVPLRPAAVAEPERVLALAADGPETLADLLRADDAAVLAAESPSGAGHARLGIVDPTPRRLALARRVVADGRAWWGRNDVWFTPRPLLGPARGKVAFLFSGLEGEFEPRVDDVADHFGLPRPGAGESARVGDVGRHGLGVVAIGLLLDSALRQMGVVPDAVAGHSVGEWTAMTAAGLFSADAVHAFMASFDPDTLAVPGLAFAAVGAPAERVLAALEPLRDSGIVLSHDNAPHQSMVCGPHAAVVEFVGSLRAQGVLGQVLPFRSGFHTPMLAPYLGPIRRAAAGFALHPPTVPVWSGTTAAPYPSDGAEVRALFIRHLLEPVRFRPLVRAMHAAGVRAFVQVGTGQLRSLVADTLEGADHLVVAANTPHRDGLAQLRRVATALWTAGAPVAPALPARAGRGAVSRDAAAAPAAGTVVRLDLRASLVSLDRARLAELRASLATARTAAAVPDPAGDAVPSALDAAARRFPVAAELSALLRETADTAAALITIRDRPHAPVPHRSGAGRTVLRVSPETMPYLLDHCFFPQRPGWPDLADRWPVVPATTIVHHLMEAAERTAPGMRAVTVHGARFDRWLTATPPVDVPITTAPEGAGRVAVSFGAHARAVVELAPGYPRPPAAWRVDPATERAPELTAAQLYTERWMFHGPGFRGITELTALGERHVRAVLTTPPAPGSLLDNVGQVLGYWIMATHAERTAVFPVQMRGMRFFGPPPRPGTRLTCLARISALTDSTLEADVQLADRGTVWAELTGWLDRRFANDPHTRRVERFPERHTLAETHPGGWSLLHDRWPDLASRELIMRRTLGAAERAEYERRPPRGRRQWLLGRIAAKDAVRQWLWDHGEGPVFPAEVRVHNDEHGRPLVTGTHGRRLPDLDVSLAHRADAAVAIVRPRRAPGGTPGPGIDIEEIADRDAGTLATALGPPELRLLRARRDDSGEPEPLWFTRFWAAKEAAAKAEGTGLRGRPRDFAVLEAAPDRLVVRAPGAAGRAQRTHLVRCARVTNPPGLPSMDYVVAWTTGDTDKDEEAQQ